jgi:hypothetical protein
MMNWLDRPNGRSPKQDFAKGVITKPQGEEYVLDLVLKKLPPIEQLETTYSGPGSISPIFGNRRFDFHPLRKGEKHGKARRIFRLHRLTSFSYGDDVIVSLAKTGWLPATHIEGHEFFMAFPELLVNVRVVTLGTYFDYEDGPCTAVFKAADGVRRMDYDWHDMGYNKGDELLFILP